MRITESVEHAATPQQVFEMICTPGYQELKCQRSGAVDHEVTIEVEAGATTVVTRRTLPTQGFPDFARRFVGDTVDVVETQRWGPPGEDGSRQAAVTVEISGTPVEMTGGASLAPGGAGTVHTVDGDLEAHVPLVGGRIERAVAPVLARAVHLEAGVGREWLETR